MAVGAKSTSIWTALALSTAMTVGGLSVWLVMKLKTHQATPAALAVIQPEADRQAPLTADSVNSEAPDFDVADGPDSDEMFMAAEVEDDPRNPLSGALFELRRETSYKLNAAQWEVNAEGERVFTGDPVILQVLMDWFYQDPDAFIELFTIHEQDSYLRSALEAVITESNVHLLADHMHVRNYEIIEIAYQNKLHYQQPELFVDIYNRFARSNFIEFSYTVIAAVAEVDYWANRNTLIEQAIYKPEPAMYFEVLASQGHENLFDLAQRMWEVHLTDDYHNGVVPGGGASYVQRIRVAFQYGVAGSPSEMLRMQREGMRVNDTIDTYCDVENASERFAEIASQLVFDRSIQRWVLP